MLDKNAMVGCVHRQRTSQPLPAAKSCASACPSELAGNSVSPSAASDPVTPTIITTTTPAIAPKGATTRILLRKYPARRLSRCAVIVSAASSSRVFVKCSAR